MHAKLVAALVIWLVWANIAQADPFSDFAVQQPQTSKSAPDFTLNDLAGKRHSLHDLHGKVVLLHFWASWCVACRHEMADLLQQASHFPQTQWLFINADRGATAADAASHFMQEVGVSFPTLLDPQGEVRNRYAIRGLPTTYAIDPYGAIIGRIIGERQWMDDTAKQWFQAIAPHQARTKEQ
ncbi:MAG: TlpA disulfide reductase family protein [Mariprofundales bacterium]